MSVKNADPLSPVNLSATAGGLESLGNAGAEGAHAAASMSTNKMTTARTPRILKGIRLLRRGESVEFIEGVAESTQR